MIPCDREALGILRRCGEVYLSDEDSLKLVALCRGHDEYDLDRIFNGLRPRRVNDKPLAGMLALLKADVPVAYFSLTCAILEAGASKMPDQYGYQEVIDMYKAGVDAVYAQGIARLGFGYAKSAIILHRAEVSFEYFEMCAKARLMSAREIAKLWSAGIPAEYVTAS